MTEVTFLSRSDCRLCETAFQVVHRVKAEIPFNLRYVEVPQEGPLADQYGSRVPIILIDQVEWFSGRVTEEELRRALKYACWRRPVSRILSRFRSLRKRG